jgi:hypothetical protein
VSHQIKDELLISANLVQLVDGVAIELVLLVGIRVTHP